MSSYDKPRVLPVHLSSVPPALAGLDRWVLWKYELRARSAAAAPTWAKVPKRIGGRNASSTDPSSWTSFQRAGRALGADARFSGLGLVLVGTDHLLGIDLDDCCTLDVLGGVVFNDNPAGWAAADAVAEVPGYWEVSPSGTGIKGFVRASGIGSQKDDGQGIEVYADGRYFTVTGHGVPGVPVRLDDTDVSEAALAWLGRHLGGPVVRSTGATPTPLPRTGDDGLDMFLEVAQTPQPIHGWGIERVRAELGPRLNVEATYDEWVRVGAALHHQFEGSDAGFDLWDDLYRTSSKYAGSEYGRERWDSFGRRTLRGQVATLAGLLYQHGLTSKQRAEEDRLRLADPLTPASDVPETPGDKALTRWTHVCEEAQSVQELLQAAERAAGDQNLDDARLKLLLDRIRERAQLEYGQRMTVGAMNQLVRRPRVDARRLARQQARQQAAADRAERAAAESVGEALSDEARAELSQWYYDTKQDRYYRLKIGPAVKAGFRMHLLAARVIGPREDPALLLVQNFPDNLVRGEVFLPGYPALVDIRDADPDGPTPRGALFCNTWEDDTRPKSEPSADASALIELHFEELLRDERERRLLKSWVAYAITHPGQRLGWAPYVYGHTKGTGKGLIGRLIAAGLGPYGVRPINPSELHGAFTDWAQGACVGVIDEVKLHGDSAYDVVNKLKAYITEPRVSIERKGKGAVTQPNTMSYLLFSNFEDGLPVEDENDRRYAFFHVGMTLARQRELTAAGHYARLAALCDGSPGAVRAWAESVEIDPEVLTQRAPLTRSREWVLEDSRTELGSALADALVSGEAGVTPLAARSDVLVRLVKPHTWSGRVSNRSLGAEMARLGFVSRWPTDARSRVQIRFADIDRPTRVWLRADFAEQLAAEHPRDSDARHRAVRAELEKGGDSTASGAADEVAASPVLL
jgi:hypothetical protein